MLRLVVGPFEIGSSILPLAASPRSPHTVSMVTIKRKVEFEPVMMKIGSGWYVRITLPDGVGPQLGGFKTEDEAREWIARESAAWLKEYEGGKYA
jgi:hypothetical protein